MINLRDLADYCPWPDELKPVGYGDIRVEDFDSWWARNRLEFHGLPKELVEQWIYRHWKVSVAKFIPIDGLGYREELWDPSDFIAKVGTVRGTEPLDPIHDFRVFSGQVGGEKLSTAKALDTGKWDYAPIVLETPDGFIDFTGTYIETPFFLVEGHKRRRYLNALLHQGVKLLAQRVFVLQCSEHFSCGRLGK